MKRTIDNRSSNFAKHLTGEILKGQYACGEKLLSERNLGELYKLSRETVRTGLSELFRIGVLERRGKGAYISSEAIEIIEQSRSSGDCRVVVIIPLRLYSNPLYFRIFETMRELLEYRLTLKVVFSAESVEYLVSQVGGDDVAVVFGDSWTEEDLRRVRDNCRSLILVNRDEEGYNYIEPDNYAGGRMMAEYVYSCGHRNIGGVIYWPKVSQEFADRVNGARDFLAERGCELILTETPSMPNVEMAGWLLRYYKKNHPELTAVLCFQDIFAISLYEVAFEEGIQIPEQLGIVGFDDCGYSSMLQPPLTTIRYPAENMGKELAGAVMSIFSSGAQEFHKKIMPVLQTRSSVMNINKSVNNKKRNPIKEEIVS